MPEEVDSQQEMTEGPEVQENDTTQWVARDGAASACALLGHAGNVQPNSMDHCGEAHKQGLITASRLFLTSSTPCWPDRRATLHLTIVYLLYETNSVVMALRALGGGVGEGV